MSYTYEPETRSATDAVTGARISSAPGITDVMHLFLYRYARGDYQVDFEVYITSENRPFDKIVRRSDGRWMEWPVATSAHIMEATLRRTFERQSKTGTQRLDYEKSYENFKQNIKEGIFALITQGGRTLTRAPEFTVEFADDLHQAKS